ncbi:helix-turn-helix domain-containing protein [Natrononativus amylolyticus]|uniref:helix-turn-helix domain-containing protein n=1 Tax=Natrononativus amylolyticus TaxID=2963434 RepID=UPI0020CE742A|nr:helix-turn-helix domain-containing protein [Natrononativus amylolyticus]
MKSVRLVVTYDAEALHPTHELVCESPRVDREYLLEGRADDGVETVLSYVEGDAEPYERVLESMDGLLEYDLRAAGDGFFVYARSELDDRGRSLASAFDRETLVVVPPIEFRPDRTMALTLIGHPADLQATVDGVPSGLEASVWWIGDHAQAAGGRLTDRQREALAVAHELGYYDVPRSVGLEAVAAELDCAKATASTLLRRGEARLVADAVVGRGR